MTAKEYADQKMEVLKRRKSMDIETKKHEGESSEDRELVKQFYLALASKDPNELNRVNDLIEKDYKAKAQDIGTIGSGTAGGVLVPTTVADSILAQMFYISPMRQIASVIDDMPAQLQLPSETAIVDAYWVAEGTEGTNTTDTLGPNLLTPWKMLGLDSFTSEILEDAATRPSLQSFIEARFGIALALLENSAFVNGSGSGQPYGFRSSAITPTTVNQAGDVLVYDDVTALKYALTTAYRKISVYVCASAGAQALEDVKDDYGHPIWREGLAEDTPAKLLGRPVYVVDEIPDNLGTGSNQTEIWQMAAKPYMVIGDRGGLRVDYGTQANDFASDQISLRVAKRVASRPINSNAFAKLAEVVAD